MIWSYPKFLDGEKAKLDKSKIVAAFKDVFSGLKLSIKKPALLKPLISLWLYTGYYKSVKDYVQPIIKTLALSTPLLAYLNDEKKTAVIIGLTFIEQYFLASVSGFVIILMIENIRKPIGISMVADNTNDKAMATILSVESQTKSLFAALIAPVLGFVADVYSPGISILVVSALLAIISLLIRTNHKKTQPTIN